MQFPFNLNGEDRLSRSAIGLPATRPRNEEDGLTEPLVTYTGNKRLQERRKRGGRRVVRRRAGVLPGARVPRRRPARALGRAGRRAAARAQAPAPRPRRALVVKPALLYPNRLLSHLTWEIIFAIVFSGNRQCLGCQ